MLTSTDDESKEIQPEEEAEKIKPAVENIHPNKNNRKKTEIQNERLQPLVKLSHRRMLKQPRTRQSSRNRMNAENNTATKQQSINKTKQKKTESSTKNESEDDDEQGLQKSGDNQKDNTITQQPEAPKNVKKKKQKHRKKHKSKTKAETETNEKKKDPMSDVIQKLADQVNSLTSSLATSNTNIKDLVKLLAAKQSECDQLTTQVQSLKAELAQAKPNLTSVQVKTTKEQKRDCLLIGDQIVQDTKQVVVGVDVECIPDLTINGAMKKIQEFATNSCGRGPPGWPAMSHTASGQWQWSWSGGYH